MKNKEKTHSLVIGGTKGIGKEVVKTFINNKHKVSVVARSLQNKQEKYTSYWSLDISKKRDRVKVLSDIVSTNGKLNNLIFLQRYRGNNWQYEIDSCLTATKETIDELIDKFQHHNSSIVIISSMASDFIAKEQSLGYHIAKAGLNQILRYYAVLLGPKGIRVNGVSPGTILKEESEDFYKKNNKIYETYKKIIPLGRMGKAEEISNVVNFLCSTQASFITGQNIIVDGGLSIQWQESLARNLVSY